LLYQRQEQNTRQQPGTPTSNPTDSLLPKTSSLASTLSTLLVSFRILDLLHDKLAYKTEQASALSDVA